jgi:TolB-like protein
VTYETGRKINILIVVLLVLAIGAVVIDRLIPEPSPWVEAEQTAEKVATEKQGPIESAELAADKFAPAPERSIAVLPFINMSPDPEQEYFSDGLSEELLNLLAKVPDLTVASRASAFYFKGKDVTIADVAKKLDVRHILEGSVRKSDDRVRITAQLIDARKDVHLWSETWERTLNEVFAIQEEIATSVVAALKVRLLGEGPAPLETDPEAYTLYLQARHRERQLSKEGMLQAIELFEKVLSIDPDYTPAWNGLGAAYSNLAAANILPRDEAYARARKTIATRSRRCPAGARLPSPGSPPGRA